MKSKNYLRYHIGSKKQNSHIDAVHAQNPRSDQYTGEIVLGVIKKINASGIIGTISRKVMDLNRPRDKSNAPAIDEYRAAIREIIVSKNKLDENNHLTKKYLHLAIHGMKNEGKREFEIGSRNGDSCSKEVINWFMDDITKLSKNVRLDYSFKGDQSKAFHRHGDPTSNYIGYGENFNTIQIEINRDWRKNRQPDLINFLSKTLLSFDEIFNS